MNTATVNLALEGRNESLDPMAMVKELFEAGISVTELEARGLIDFERIEMSPVDGFAGPMSCDSLDSHGNRPACLAPCP